MTRDPQLVAVNALRRGHQIRLKEIAKAERAVRLAVAQCRISRPATRGHPEVRQATWVWIGAVVEQKRQNAWRKYGPDTELIPLMRAGSVPPLQERIAALDAAYKHLVEVTSSAEAGDLADVAVCRQLGCSWTPISAALGLQHRKAADKYAHRLQVHQTITVRAGAS